MKIFFWEKKERERGEGGEEAFCGEGGREKKKRNNMKRK